MDNKSYEDKINDIKKYLEEKEKEVNKNRVNTNRSNPIKNDNDLIFDDDFSTIYKKELNEKIENEKEELSIKIEKSNKKDDKKNIEVNDNNKTCKLNLILFILLFITPLFMTLSIISSNSTYLIRKPFNFVFYALTGISMVWIVCLLLLKSL